jgi:hypothetical protein
VGRVGRVADDGKRSLVFNQDGKETSDEDISGNDLWLRSEMDGATARFSYSTNGQSWSRLGPEFKVTFGNWRGDRLGFHCWNDATDDAARSGYLDVDWFVTAMIARR